MPLWHKRLHKFCAKLIKIEFDQNFQAIYDEIISANGVSKWLKIASMCTFV